MKRSPPSCDQVIVNTYDHLMFAGEDSVHNVTAQFRVRLALYTGKHRVQTRQITRLSTAYTTVTHLMVCYSIGKWRTLDQVLMFCLTNYGTLVLNKARCERLDPLKHFT